MNEYKNKDSIVPKLVDYLLARIFEIHSAFGYKTSVMAPSQGGGGCPMKHIQAFGVTN